MTPAERAEQSLGIVRTIARAWGNRETFNELVSIGSEALLRAARTWSGKGDFRAYAAASIRNAIRAHGKSESRYYRTHEDIAEYQDDPRLCAVDPEIERAEERADTAQVMAALATLTLRRRQIIEAVILQDRDPLDVAREVGYSHRNVVYVTRDRALADLRRAVGA